MTLLDSKADGAVEDADRFQPIMTWQVMLSGSLLLSVALLIVAFFSQTFDYGDDVINYLLVDSWKPVATYGTTVAIFLVLYLFDFSYWTGTLGVAARRLGVAVLIFFVCASGMLSMASLPVLPLCIFLLLLPLAALFLHNTLFAKNPTVEVTYVMSFNFFSAAFIVLATWLLWLGGAWTTSDNHWYQNRARFIDHAQCDAGKATGAWRGGTVRVQDAHGDDELCLAAFLLWISPMILFGTCLLLGAFMLLVARSLRHGDRSSTRVASRLLTTAVLVAFVGMWMAASIGGAGMKLSNAAVSVFAVLILAVGLVGASTIGWNSLKGKIKDSPALQRLYALGPPYADIFHGFLLCCGPILYFPFLLLSLLNQAVRKATCCSLLCGLSNPCGIKPLDDDERARFFTTAAHKTFDYMNKWDWTKALLYANYWCWLAWVIKYGTIVTQIFLNWLIGNLASLNWAVVSAVFVVIGLVMFLLPFVPGPMVYLASGILIVPVSEAAWAGTVPTVGADCAAENATSALGGNSSSGSLPGEADGLPSLSYFFAACAWACTISYVLKLIAHVLQQKCIGETLGGRVSIRAACSPNSSFMKALRILLEQPGVTLPKACMLCGGPDWPTSVLCGILRLNCCQMVIGLLPMWTMTIPSTLVGAFITRKEPAILPNLVTFMAAVVVFVQGCCALGCVVFARGAQTRFAKEIAEIPDDEEVLEFDAKAAKVKDVRDRVINWSEMPNWARYTLGTGTTVLIGTCYVLVLQPSRLFRPFSLTDCLNLLAEPPYDSVIPGTSFFGVVALLGFAFSLACFQIFSSWAGRATRQACAFEFGVVSEAPGSTMPELRVNGV